jgi:hypothetical protein
LQRRFALALRSRRVTRKMVIIGIGGCVQFRLAVAARRSISRQVRRYRAAPETQAAAM